MVVIIITIIIGIIIINMYSSRLVNKKQYFWNHWDFSTAHKHCRIYV